MRRTDGGKTILWNTPGDAISVSGGLQAILAYKRESAYMYMGVLNQENKLDGEGPFRVVVPQKYAVPPDPSSMADAQNVLWPYDYDLDHNAGSCSRSATIIKIEPLPEGTTDIDTLEAGWSYVDQQKIIIYGAIDGTDSNGNGVLGISGCRAHYGAILQSRRVGPMDRSRFWQQQLVLRIDLHKRSPYATKRHDLQRSCRVLEDP